MTAPLNSKIYQFFGDGFRELIITQNITSGIYYLTALDKTYVYNMFFSGVYNNFNSTPISIDQNCGSNILVNMDLILIGCPSFNNGSGILYILDSGTLMIKGKIVGNSTLMGVGSSMDI